MSVGRNIAKRSSKEQSQSSARRYYPISQEDLIKIQASSGLETQYLD